MKSRIFVLFAVSTAALLAQAPPPTILEVDIENYVFYYLDVTDPAKLATSAAPVLTGPGRTFRWQVSIADVIAINGKPAKGLYAGRSMPLMSTSKITPGQAIADVASFGLNDIHLVILQPDGTEIGSLFGLGVGGTAAPPGAPQGATVHNLAVAGGTGAFLGARGQWAFKQALGGTSRAVSMAEDPSNRRINGGSSRRDIIRVIPMTWPEVWTLPAGPAIFHGADFSLVTTEKPARAGELLIMGVKGLGPVKGKVDPGQPFPAGDLLEVNSPFEVMVNGKSATVATKVGWPTLTDVYRVDFVVPEGTAPGMASVVPIVAWINGSEVKIPVR